MVPVPSRASAALGARVFAEEQTNANLSGDNYSR
jgi:hypothetical protein